MSPYKDCFFYQGKRSECKKFRFGIPEYINLLAEMYQGVTVDGLSSCIPGQQYVDPNQGGDEEEAFVNKDDVQGGDDPFSISPMNIGSKKRGSSTTSTGASPVKKSKRPMMHVFKGLINSIDNGGKVEKATLDEMYTKKMEDKARQRDQRVQAKKKQEDQETREIEASLEMAIQCGASEASNEYYIVTKLFRDKYNRIIFSKFKTDEGKLSWLTRSYEDRSG